MHVKGKRGSVSKFSETRQQLIVFSVGQFDRLEDGLKPWKISKTTYYRWRRKYGANGKAGMKVVNMPGLQHVPTNAVTDAAKNVAWGNASYGGANIPSHFPPDEMIIVSLKDHDALHELVEYAQGECDKQAELANYFDRELKLETNRANELRAQLSDEYLIPTACVLWFVLGSMVSSIIWRYFA